ncbi:MAG: hypothetical protein HN368_21295, partial [Spirochaetales bacterium]|nr:hypothetical protein [Spirochaetales bacterium]
MKQFVSLLFLSYLDMNVPSLIFSAALFASNAAMTLGADIDTKISTEVKDLQKITSEFSYAADVLDLRGAFTYDEYLSLSSLVLSLPVITIGTLDAGPILSLIHSPIRSWSAVPPAAIVREYTAESSWLVHSKVGVVLTLVPNHLSFFALSNTERLITGVYTYLEPESGMRAEVTLFFTKLDASGTPDKWMLEKPAVVGFGSFAHFFTRLTWQKDSGNWGLGGILSGGTVSAPGVCAWSAVELDTKYIEIHVEASTSSNEYLSLEGTPPSGQTVAYTRLLFFPKSLVSVKIRHSLELLRLPLFMVPYRSTREKLLSEIRFDGDSITASASSELNIKTDIAGFVSNESSILVTVGTTGVYGKVGAECLMKFDDFGQPSIEVDFPVRFVIHGTAISFRPVLLVSGDIQVSGALNIDGKLETGADWHVRVSSQEPLRLTRLTLDSIRRAPLSFFSLKVGWNS